MNEIGKTDVNVKVGGNLNEQLKTLGLNPLSGATGLGGQTLEKMLGEAVKSKLIGGEFDSLKSLGSIQTELSSKGNQIVGVHPTHLPSLRSPISQSLKMS